MGWDDLGAADHASSLTQIDKRAVASVVAMERQVNAVRLVPWLVRKLMVREVGAQEIADMQTLGTQARYAVNGRLQP